MIDWTKPIETTDGKEAFYLRDSQPNGQRLITYSSVGKGWKTSVVDNDCLFIRNKPETITPQGWVWIDKDGSCHGPYCKKDDASHEQIMFGGAVLSAKDLFGDREIPMGYVSEEE